MSDFLKDIIKETGNEFATLAKDGVGGGDVDSFIDTEPYSFNALLYRFYFWWFTRQSYYGNCR